jgi:NAD+ kinase
VCRAFDAEQVPYRLVYRARQLDFAPYSLVVAVGGDGTFIEAARRITTQPVLGVNSDPKRSLGVFCATTGDEFHRYLPELRRRRPRLRQLTRLDLHVNGQLYPFRAINEILLAHQSPAAMSRYVVETGGHSEAQRSSGIWVSTAAGSTGAIHSAGGTVMPMRSQRLQYRPRELFHPAAGDRGYRLTGGILRRDETITLHSRMREGMVFIDGPHLRCPLPFGNRLQLTRSAHPLLVLARA